MELNAPYFLHEVIKRLLILATEKTTREEELAVQLIQSLEASGAVSRGQLAMGLDRVNKALPDMVLDSPAAAESVARMQAALALASS